MGYSLLDDKEENFKAMRRLQNQREEKKHHVVKLPCHGASIELIDNQTDYYLKCPECGKKYLLTHSIVNNKLYSED